MPESVWWRVCRDEGILKHLVLFFVINANLSVLGIAVFSPHKAIDLFVCRVVFKSGILSPFSN